MVMFNILELMVHVTPSLPSGGGGEEEVGGLGAA